MKKLILCIVAIVAAAAAAYAADDSLILNNGTVLTGKVAVDTASQTVTVVTSSGNVYSYPLVEVNKINYATEVKIPKVKGPGFAGDYLNLNTGFWCAAELMGAYSCNIGHDKTNIPFAEFDVVGGYRFGEYARVGVGVGARYYVNNEDLRYSSTEWGFPLFFNIRGNFISMDYYSVVPYYSLDLGTSTNDGFMVRPTIGVRVGQNRSAFLVGLSYVGQNLKSFEVVNSERVKKWKFTSFVALKVGYEF